MKAAEMRDLDKDALESKVRDLDDQLFRMRIQKAMGQLETPGRVRGIRRDLARVMTILKEKAQQS